MDAFYEAAAQLPQPLRAALLSVPADVACRITEIRLRSARPVTLSTYNQMLYLSPHGRPLSLAAGSLLQTSHTELEVCFRAICGYSVHSYEQEIANGFVPLRGGHRAGICGTAFYNAEHVLSIKNITSINIRVARQSICRCDTALIPLLKTAQPGVVIAGAPGSGKTTLLRGAVAALSNLGRKVALVDERLEISPVDPSGFSAPLAQHVDVLSGYPKHIGMMHALRGLAPDVIVCDEVGGMEDVAAIESVANAGVGMVVSMHGDTLHALLRRPQAKAVLQTGAFAYIAFLQSKETPGVIREVCHVDDIL